MRHVSNSAWNTFFGENTRQFPSTRGSKELPRSLSASTRTSDDMESRLNSSTSAWTAGVSLWRTYPIGANAAGLGARGSGRGSPFSRLNRPVGNRRREGGGVRRLFPEQLATAGGFAAHRRDEP